MAAPSALAVQGDITRFDLRPGSVDAVASFYAFGHVPSRLHADLFMSIGRWLRPGGVLLANAPVDAGDDIDPAWMGVPMFFGGIGEDATRIALNAAGLELQVLETLREDEGHGHVVRFHWLIAKKRANR
jgi:SAM-dependent methyltransferase